MPKTTKSGKPIEDELPSPVQRSSTRAQETFAKTYDSAMEQYDDEGRANATAYASLKRTHERVGDKWVAKKESGPSDERAEEGGLNDKESAGGVDANATKTHLLDVAKRLQIRGRTRMTKDELVEAIRTANDKANEKARER
ncbi:MAG TPA: ChaB family protein [Tetrasphaera sp.]|mgnify:CR=1 FL=1|nr:ChaB family protein [Tetrasphaera sp.]